MSFTWYDNDDIENGNEGTELQGKPNGGSRNLNKQSHTKETSEHNLSYEDQDGDSSEVNSSIEDISVPIVTNELEPSVWTKVFRLLRNIILFPTKVSVVLAALTFLWLLCCATWIGYGLTNDHYCPADPTIPQVIAWQGILWVAFSVYVIIRLIWVEISPSKTATCSWRIGNPDVIVKWRKEFTYGLDAVFILILLACYVIEFVLLVRLTENDVDFQDTTTEDWPQCRNCCRRSVVQFGASQLFVSYIAMIVFATMYLYVLGWLENIRRRVCHCDIGSTSEEATRLV